MTSLATWRTTALTVCWHKLVSTSLYPVVSDNVTWSWDWGLPGAVLTALRCWHLSSTHVGVRVLFPGHVPSVNSFLGSNSKHTSTILLPPVSSSFQIILSFHMGGIMLLIVTFFTLLWLEYDCPCQRLMCWEAWWLFGRSSHWELIDFDVIIMG